MFPCRTNLFLRQIWRNFSKSPRTFEKAPKIAPAKQASAELAAAPKDIILYKFEKPRFYKYLNLFAVTQYGFWMVISYCGFQMIDIPTPQPAEKPKEDDDVPFWRKLNLGSDKYKYGLAVGSAFMGCAILFVSWTYILRSVRYLVLRKDGKTVSFVTYTPSGRNRILDVPLNCVSAEGSRASGTSQMPIKVKGRWLFYLVDLKEGKFPQPQLFDRTVGTKRKL